MKQPIQTATSKDETVFKIAISILALESRRGHLAWKVTEVERNTSVSRSLIYRYFGSGKKEMLIEALRSFTDRFYGFDRLNTHVDIAAQIGKARELMVEHYEAIVFYQKWRTQKSFLQDEFIKIELRFHEQLSRAYPNLNSKKILQLRVFIHGLVTSPFLTPNEAQDLCVNMLQGVEKNVE